MVMDYNCQLECKLELDVIHESHAGNGLQLKGMKTTTWSETDGTK
jgi:hypothetical protein